MMLYFEDIDVAEEHSNTLMLQKGNKKIITNKPPFLSFMQ